MRISIAVNSMSVMQCNQPYPAQCTVHNIVHCTISASVQGSLVLLLSASAGKERCLPVPIVCPLLHWPTFRSSAWIHLQLPASQYLFSYLGMKIPASIWYGDLSALQQQWSKVTMRVFTGAVCCFLLIQNGTPVRDGFQPLPLRPQDQIKGIGKIVWDNS